MNVYTCVGITLALALMADPQIDPYSVLGPNGNGNVENSIVISINSKDGNIAPIEDPPLQLRVGNDLKLVYSTGNCTLWTISEYNEAYNDPNWDIVSPNLASDLNDVAPGYEIGWSLNGGLQYPPEIRKIALKRYPNSAGIFDLELFKGLDYTGNPGNGWDWLSNQGQLDAKAEYQYVSYLSLSELNGASTYPGLVSVDDASIDEGSENPNPWKRNYDGIQSIHSLDQNRLLTFNHTEHANSIANAVGYPFVYNAIDYNLVTSPFNIPPNLSEQMYHEIPADAASPNTYYYVQEYEMEIYNNLFRPDYVVEYDENSRTYNPLTYGYAQPIFFKYWYYINGNYMEPKKAWHQGLDWTNYYSFITINVINLDTDGNALSTDDYGPVVWPVAPYLNADGTRHTRGVRNPNTIIRQEGSDEYIYLFYSEMIGQEYEEAIELGQQNPTGTYPVVKLARAKLNRTPGQRPFDEFKGYIGNDYNGNPVFVAPTIPTYNGHTLRYYLDNQPRNLNTFMEYMKRTATSNQKLNDFTGYKQGSAWAWELDHMTYRWEAIWAEKRSFEGISVAKVKDTPYYISLEQIEYGGRHDGNLAYTNPRTHWRWVGSSIHSTEEIINGTDRLYLRVSDDLVNWSDPVILNPGQVGNVSTSTQNATYTFYQSLNNGFDVYADNAGYIFSGLPTYLEGKGFIQTPLPDNSATASNYLSFSSAGPMIVYVAFDTRYSLPSWLSSWDWTGDTVTIQSGGSNYSMDVYEKVFEGDSIVLGGNGHNGLMYSVFFDLGTTTINHPRFLSADGGSNTEIDINDFYIIGAKHFIREPEDDSVLNAEGNVPVGVTARLRLSLDIENP